MAYLETVEKVYKQAAEEPQSGLCCTTSPVWKLPGLNTPKEMMEMNYGCGSTVHLRDLQNQPTVVYLGVGGGLELLQFAFFVKKEYGVIGIDPVKEMLAKCRSNLERAKAANPWFSNDFIDLKLGSALDIPLQDSSVELVAQNCLFNIFKENDLNNALSEAHRILKPGGRLILSDPICDQPIPIELRDNEKLRAQCLSGALTLENYTDLLSDTGFGTIEIRARRPYRILDKVNYPVNSNILIESIEVCAIKEPVSQDGPCIFTGREAIYYGNEPFFDDNKGHILKPNQPLSICDKTANALKDLNEKIHVTNSTWFYTGGGCC